MVPRQNFKPEQGVAGIHTRTAQKGDRPNPVRRRSSRIQMVHFVAFAPLR
jgi:hypothetical protein